MRNEILKYSIVIPVYKSGLWIDELVARIEAVMEQEAPDSFELILVDDCSPDSVTWSAIEQNASQQKWVRGFRLLYNVGQPKATMCGLENSSGQYIITMDDDLQHPPEELPKLFEAMRQNPTMDCIMGNYIVKRHSVKRNIGSWLTRVIKSRLYNMPSDIIATSFRIMPASFAHTLLLYRIADPQLGPLIASLTQNILNIPVEHNERKYGVSGYRLLDGIKITLSMVINASIVPLRLFSLLGFIAAGIAFITSFYFFLRWVLGGIGVAGFTTLVLAITFFSGMILSGIGILGEYIGRIIKELTGLPIYRIKLITSDRMLQEKANGEKK